jgi:hypothetical protein
MEEWKTGRVEDWKSGRLVYRGPVYEKWVNRVNAFRDKVGQESCESGRLLDREAVHL